MIQPSDKYKRLITRHLAGETRAEEEQHLQEWIAASEENRDLYEEFKAVWTLQPAKSTLPEINRDQAWQDITQRIQQAEAPSSLHRSHTQSTGRIRQLYRISAVAAAIIILFGLYFLIFNQKQPDYLEYFAENRPQQALILSDETRVFPSAGSSLRYPERFTGKERRISLAGSAFFEVEHMTGKPFIIHLGEAVVKVLGTSFNISRNDDKNLIEVMVVEGKVLVYSTVAEFPAEIILSEGEMARLNYKEKSLEREAISNYNFLAWKTGLLEFSQAPLEEVFKTLEETYQIKIIVEADISDLKLTARFSNEKYQDIFKTISMLFSLGINEHKGSYFVR